MAVKPETELEVTVDVLEISLGMYSCQGYGYGFALAISQNGHLDGIPDGARVQNGFDILAGGHLSSIDGR